jgi:hypothetical protein
VISFIPWPLYPATVTSTRSTGGWAGLKSLSGLCTEESVAYGANRTPDAQPVARRYAELFRLLECYEP